MIKRKLLFPGAVKLLCSGIALAMTLSFAYTPVTAIAKVKDEAIYNADGLEDYMAEREKSKAFDEENSAKAQAWFAAFTDYCNRMNLNEDVYLVKIEDEFIKPVMEWEASDETFNKLVKAVDYDKDVDDAFEAGEIKGRNTNIHEMRSKPSDGMPSGLSSQAPVVEKPKVRRNPLIADALKA